MSDDENDGMNDERDEEIQRRLDTGEPAGEGADASAYRRLYEELSRSPARLPTSFAYTVMQRILEARIQKQESLSLLVSLGLGVGSLAFGLVFLLVMTSQGYASNLDVSLLKTLAAIPSSSTYFVYSLLALVLITGVDIIINRLMASRMRR